MAGLMSIAGNSFEAYKCCANDVINFKLVRSEADVFDDTKAFKPDMAHQIFGDSESIFGYKDLRVNLYCTAARMTTFIDFKYSEKISPDQCDGVNPDDILKMFSESVQPGYLTSQDQLIAHIEKDKTFKPFGELLNSYTVTRDGEERQFEIYKHTIETAGFRDFHERIQLFLLFYVDAASYIDVDDERWMFYVMYEKYNNSDGNPMHAFAGYMTVYNYYAYPEKIRPRVSQVLVMPPFQRQGHGAKLIQTFYNECYSRPEVLDITVEDQSENFQRVRDFVDAENCLGLASFEADKLKQGFSEGMVKEAKDKLRINKKQTRRVYEILRLKATNCSDPEEYKAYRLEIKKRLNIPFLKTGRDCERWQKVLKPSELTASTNLTEEQRHEYLDKQFQECLDEYTHILNRLASAS